MRPTRAEVAQSALLGLLALAALPGCEEPRAAADLRSGTKAGLASDTLAAPAQRPPGISAPPARPLPARVQRGVCYAHNWQHGGTRGYGTRASRTSKKALKALGVTWLSLTPFGFQRGLRAREVRVITNMSAGESDRRVEREVRQARTMGFKILLKPHLWLSYSAWRGNIQPAGPDGWKVWFRSYRKFILHYAHMAQRLGVNGFVIGVELKSSSASQAAEWRKTIAAVRKVYRGSLTYAANWDEVSLVPFWDQLDWIGVQFFPPLTRKTDPTYEDLVAGLAPHLQRYQRVARRFGKPILFTEMGYKSVRGTAISPHAWPEHLEKSQLRLDEGAQALAYRAFFNEIGRRPEVVGVHVWKWFTDLDTDEEGRLGFSPFGKAAARVMKEAFALPR